MFLNIKPKIGFDIEKFFAASKKMFLKRGEAMMSIFGNLINNIKRAEGKNKSNEKF